MTLAHQNIIATFEGARSQESPFVFVGVEAEGIKEIIAVPAESYDAKEQFYLRSYTNELVHVMNSNVRIFGLSHGDNDCLRDVLGERGVCATNQKGCDYMFNKIAKLLEREKNE